MAKKWPRLPVLDNLRHKAESPLPKGAPTCCDLAGRVPATADVHLGKPSPYALLLPNPDLSARGAMAALGLPGAHIMYATRCGAGTAPLEGKHFMSCRPYLKVHPEVTKIIVFGERAWYTLTGRKTQPRSTGSVPVQVEGRTVTAILVDEDTATNPFALAQAKKRLAKDPHPPSPCLVLQEPPNPEDVRKAGLFAFDYETYGKLYSDEFRIISVSIAYRASPDLVHAYTWEGSGPAWLLSLLSDPDIRKIAHNAVYDMRCALRADSVYVENIEDTLVMRKLINPDGDGSLDALAEICGIHSHKWVADLHIDAVIAASKTLSLKTAKAREKSFDNYVAKHLPYIAEAYAAEFVRLSDEGAVPKEERVLSKVFAYMDPALRSEYNSRDSYVTLIAYEHLTETIQSGPLAHFYETHVKPASQALFRMALTGIQVDTAMAEGVVLWLADKADKALEKFQDDYGVNPNARKDILAYAIKHKIVPKDTTSLDKAALKAIKHPFAEDLQTYRRVKKRLDAAIAVYEAAWPTDGRIRPSFNMAGTRTGRISCSEPNLQNIPKPGEGDEDSEAIRMCFAPGLDTALVQVDYSQVELVVMAALAKDSVAMKAIKSGSFHMDTARMVVPLALKIPVSEVTDKHKKYGKICNFAWLYGASDKKIAETLNVDEKTAKKCRTKVFSYFNATGKFIERTHAIAAKQGYIRTVFRGESARFRLLFDFGSKNRSQVGSAKRKSFNTVVQGSANDVCLQALVRVDRYFQERPYLGRVVLSIHDALLFEIPTHLASSVLEDICRMMTEDVGFPVDVEAEWGPNWSEQSVWKPGDAPTWDQPEPTPALKPTQIKTTHTKNQPTIH